MPGRLRLLVAVCAIAGGAAAADDPTRRQFDPDPARLALSLDGGFTSETAAVAERGSWRFASVFDVANGLLVLQQGSPRQDLLASPGPLHLLGGWSLGGGALPPPPPGGAWRENEFSPL